MEIKFVKAEAVDKSIYYPKFIYRDNKARTTYKEEIAKIYKENHFESTRCYINKSIQYPHLTLGFLWLLRIRCGYKLNAAVAIAAGFVSDETPRYCPCCKGGTQSFMHWIMVCPTFNSIRVNRLGNTVKILDFFE